MPYTDIFNPVPNAASSTPLANTHPTIANIRQLIFFTVICSLNMNAAKIMTNIGAKLNRIAANDNVICPTASL